jgi:hypothetical protein
LILSNNRLPKTSYPHVSEVGTVFEFFLSRFTQRLVLTLEMVVLDAEFNSLSNGMTFYNDHRPKMGSYDEKLGFSSSFCSEIFSFLSRFVQRLVLTLEMVVSDAEFNSLSNGTSFDRDYR